VSPPGAVSLIEGKFSG